MKQNITWRVGDGKRIQFWNDHWVPGYSILRDVAVRPFDLIESFKLVSDYYDPSMGWNIQHLNSILSPEIVDKIKAF